jgi:hypothetical protein
MNTKPTINTRQEAAPSPSSATCAAFCRMFGKLLALAEDDGFARFILEDRAAQDAVRRRFGFFGDIEEVGVGSRVRLSSPKEGLSCKK